MRQVRAGSKRGFDENQNGHAKMPKFDSEPSPLVNLPTEIWMNILTKLDPLSLTSLSMADSYFNNLTSDNLIWKKLYKTDYPARHSKMIGLRDVLKHISWKDSYNADSKVQIELRWANQNCVPCIRELPLKCTCDRKTVQVKKYMEVYHIQYHVKKSICFFNKETGYLSPRTPIKEIHTADNLHLNCLSMKNPSPISPSKPPGQVLYPARFKYKSSSLSSNLFPVNFKGRGVKPKLAQDLNSNNFTISNFAKFGDWQQNLKLPTSQIATLLNRV